MVVMHLVRTTTTTAVTPGSLPGRQPGTRTSRVRGGVRGPDTADNTFAFNKYDLAFGELGVSGNR